MNSLNINRLVKITKLFYMNIPGLVKPFFFIFLITVIILYFPSKYAIKVLLLSSQIPFPAPSRTIISSLLFLSTSF